jgi:hypothetical protein
MPRHLQVALSWLRSNALFTPPASPQGGEARFASWLPWILTSTSTIAACVDAARVRFMFFKRITQLFACGEYRRRFQTGNENQGCRCAARMAA